MLNEKNEIMIRTDESILMFSGVTEKNNKDFLEYLKIKLLKTRKESDSKYHRLHHQTSEIHRKIKYR